MLIELVGSFFISAGTSWFVCHKYITIGLIDKMVEKRATERVDLHHHTAAGKQRAVHNEAKHLNIQTSKILRDGDEMLVAVRQLTEKNELLEAKCEDLLAHAKNVLHTAQYGRS